MKETIIVFSDGDSTLLSTWSNVPYMMTTTLEKLGYEVVRGNIRRHEHIRYLYDVCFRYFILRGSSYDYGRSFLCHFLTRRYMKKVIKNAQKQGKNIKCCITMAFGFGTKQIANVPCVLFGDWCYEYYLKKFREREPDWLEKRELVRENSEIEKADYVIALFPYVCDWMKERYINRNILYLGNVINAVEEPQKEDLKIKRQSNVLLFIGRAAYIESAIELIKAADMLNQEGHNYVVHIVGLTESDFTGLELKQYVKCYGYLSKDNDEQRELYYTLIRQANICINTTPKWAAMSSVLEEMYFYNPIITVPNDNFVEMFGEEISFGRYVEHNAAELIAQAIREIDSDEVVYDKMCCAAHEAVDGFTWEEYVKKMLQCIK